MKKRKKDLSALFLASALIIFWQAVAMKINASYIIPSPIQIIEKIWELREPLFTVHLPATMAVTFLGLIISVILGTALAAVMDMSETVENAVYPLVIVSQTIPTTAIAPIFVLWFGYEMTGRVLVTVLMTFFPITITVFDGFKSVNGDMLDLLTTMGANKRQIFLKLKAPAALPYFFSAMKMAVPLCVIGAAIAEWLGAQSGLGYFSRRMMTQLDGAGVFAPIVILSIAAMAAVKIVSAAEKKLVRWRGEH